MDTTEKEQVTTTKITHVITCDVCGKEINKSVELEDGYFENVGKYEQSFQIWPAGGRVGTRWGEHPMTCRFKADLCTECAKNKTQDIITALYDLGFREVH